MPLSHEESKVYFCAFCNAVMTQKMRDAHCGNRVEQLKSYNCRKSCVADYSFDLMMDEKSIFSMRLDYYPLNIHVYSLAYDGKCIGSTIDKSRNYIFSSPHWNDMELLTNSKKLIQKIKLHAIFA